MGLNASLLSFREANLPLIQSGSRIKQIGSTHKRNPGEQGRGYAEGMVRQLSWRRRESVAKQYSRLLD